MSVVLAFAAPPAADAQPRAGVAPVGYLESGTAAGTPLYEAFRQGLQELGWVEGQNLAREVRSAAGTYERLPALGVSSSGSRST